MNIDIHTYTCYPPLGVTVEPHTPVSGKGSRITHLCKCGKKINSCGQKEFIQGRFHIFYSINNIASCSSCWMEIYTNQEEEE